MHIRAKKVTINIYGKTPDKPRLVWPAESRPEPAEEETPEPETPRPEDVPAGEAWLVNTREGEQREALKAGNRWYVKDGDDVEEWVEEALTPIARLVPGEEIPDDDLPDHVEEALTQGIEDMKAGRVMEFNLGEGNPEPQPGEAWLIEVDPGDIRIALLNKDDDGELTWFTSNGDGFYHSCPVLQRLVPEVAPKVLLTEEDYREATDGTICAGVGGVPFYASEWAWKTIVGGMCSHRDLAGTPRRVLRWGMGEQA